MLKNKTVLETADKPFIDGIASKGFCGRIYPQNSTRSFLLKLLTGQRILVPRGILEAFHFKPYLNKQHVAYRLSPAILNRKKIMWIYNLTYKAKLRLMKAVTNTLKSMKEVKAEVFLYGNCKGVLLLKDLQVSRFPPPPSPSLFDPDEIESKTLKKFIIETAKKTNGMFLMPWGGGRLPINNLKPKTRSLAIISKSPLTLGLGKLLGLKTIKISSWLNEGLTSSLDNLPSTNVLFHIEKTDELSHMKLPLLKLSTIEKIDRKLKEKMEGKNIRVSLVVDHGTSSITGEHLEIKTPFCVFEGKNSFKSNVEFQEGTDGCCFHPEKLLEVLLNEN